MWSPDQDEAEQARFHTPRNKTNQTLNTEAHAEAPLKSTEATCGHSPMTLKVFTLTITGVKATQRACIFHR